MFWKQMVDWQEAESILSRVEDQVGQRIDAAILAPVVGLNLLGLHTSASCEGHLDWGCPYPWIEFYRDVALPDYARAAEIASGPDAEPQEGHAAQEQMQSLLSQFVQHDPLYQALAALLTDYSHARRAAVAQDHGMRILLVPFAPGWYRLLAAEPSWWRRWEASERLEQTAWWDTAPHSERAEMLARAQEEMASFAAFLKARWQASARSEAAQV